MRIHNSSEVRDRQGFSLIEILGVVAIIAILGAVVVANLSGARASARDKFAMTSMQSMIIEASMYRANAGTYYRSATDNVCIALQPLRTKVQEATNNAPTCGSDAAGYEAQALLISNVRYCIDSSRYYGTTTTTNLNNNCRS